MKTARSRFLVVPILLVAALILSPLVVSAETGADIDRDVNSAIAKLYRSTPAAEKLSKVAKGVLVFPSVVKGGLIIGGQYGKGALRIGGKTEGYYSTAAASYGLQIGAQTFGYAMFFMTESALEYLKKSSGWEIGAGRMEVGGILKNSPSYSKRGCVNASCTISSPSLKRGRASSIGISSR